MADDRSEEVEMEGEEEEEDITSIMTGSEPEPSVISVGTKEKSQSSMEPAVPEVPEQAPEPPVEVPEFEPEPIPVAVDEPEPPQDLVEEREPEQTKSRSSVKGAEKSKTSVQKVEQSKTSFEQAETSRVSFGQVEEPRTSASLSEKSQPNLVGISEGDGDEPPDLEGVPRASQEEGEPAQGELEQTAEVIAAEVAEVIPEVEPEPPRYVEPRGEATEESLAEGELKPFILEKLFNEGRMGRFGLASGVPVKMEEGGIKTFEDYKWQLEKMFRQVPADMSLGKVRQKPDDLLYEEEKWVLGKMFRDIQEEDYGYQPIAEKQQSLVALDLSEAIEVNQFPVEPPQCNPPPSLDDPVDSFADTQCGGGSSNKPCTARVMTPSGKVFEFSYAGIMSVAVDCDQQGAAQPPPPPTGGVGRISGPILKESSSRPITPFDSQVQSPQVTNMNKTSCEELEAPSQFFDTCGGAGSGSKLTLLNSAEVTPVAAMPISRTSANKASVSGDRTCRNKMRCDSNIKAVCDAARRAMAIYDTVTGCDNFPCNEGDRPEKELENVEDGVWPWLYQLIYRMVPVDTNQNPLVTIPEEPNGDDPQLPEDL